MNTHNSTQMQTTLQITDRSHLKLRLWGQSTPIESKLTFPGRILVVLLGGHLNGCVIPDAFVS